MKYTYLFVFTSFLILFTGVQVTLAGPNNFFFDWGSSDFEHRYENSMNNGYNSDWEYPGWTPTSWADNVTNAQIIVNDFYENGVVTDQFLDDGVPVLEVGQTFIDLSGRDQRRVVKFMAYAFNVDRMTGEGFMQVRLKRGCLPLGLYSNGDVQLY